MYKKYLLAALLCAPLVAQGSWYNEHPVIRKEKQFLNDSLKKITENQDVSNSDDSVIAVEGCRRDIATINNEELEKYQAYNLEFDRLCQQNLQTPYFNRSIKLFGLSISSAVAGIVAFIYGDSATKKYVVPTATVLTLGSGSAGIYNAYQARRQASCVITEFNEWKQKQEDQKNTSSSAAYPQGSLVNLTGDKVLVSVKETN